jgi:hypothetical protein
MAIWLKRVGRVFVLKGQVVSAQWQRLGKMNTMLIFRPEGAGGRLEGLEKVGRVEKSLKSLKGLKKGFEGLYG